MTIWESLKKKHTGLELSKMIMKDYVELKQFVKVTEKYKVTYPTLFKFIQSNRKYFDKEAKQLFKQMDIVKTEVRRNQINSARENKLKNIQNDKVYDCKTINKKLTYDEFMCLEKLRELPKVITYDEFLNKIFNLKLQKLSSEQWIQEANIRGIKVIL